MRTFNIGINAPLTGTSRRSATMRHRELTKYCECDAQLVSGFCVDKTCGNIQVQENFEMYESVYSTRFEFFQKEKMQLKSLSSQCPQYTHLRSTRIIKNALNIYKCTYLKVVLEYCVYSFGISNFLKKVF